MKIAYVAGPYRDPRGEWYVWQNIQRAREVAMQLWQAGYGVFCPHSNTFMMGGGCDDSVWLKGDLEILSRCDLIVMLPGWEQSQGAKAELEMALLKSIPTFMWADERDRELLMEAGQW